MGLEFSDITQEDNLVDITESKGESDYIEENNMNEIKNESKISRTLSDKTTKVVIILVLIMLFTNPLFLSETYITDESSFRDGMELIEKFEF